MWTTPPLPGGVKAGGPGGHLVSSMVAEQWGMVKDAGWMSCLRYLRSLMLVRGGASEEKARKAAEAVAQYDQRNPMGYPPKVTHKPLAPRLETLDGKTVYLVDCRFDDADIFLKQVQAWFAEHMPGVRTSVQADLKRLYARRPGHLGGDQGQRRRRHHWRRPLKHLCAGGRRARDDHRPQVWGAHGRVPYAHLRARGALGGSSTACRACGRSSCRSR